MNPMDELKAIRGELFAEYGEMYTIVASYCVGCQKHRMNYGGFEDHMNDYNARWLTILASISPPNAPNLIREALVKAKRDGDAKAEALLRPWFDTYCSPPEGAQALPAAPDRYTMPAVG